MLPRFILALAVILALSTGPAAADEKVPPLKLSQRHRSLIKDHVYEIRTKEVLWAPAQTALIVCDMWDAHHCLNAVRRVEEMAPRMNKFLEEARSRGALIIHAPSGCMAPYKDHPGRKLAQAAPKAANLPADIGQWCYKIPNEE